MSLRLAWATDAGLHRENNEDSVLVWENRAGIEALLVVADGMGGHAAGQLASSITIQVLTEELERDGGSGCDPARLHNAFRKANSAVFKASKEVPDAAGMGSTLTVVAIDKGQLGLLNVGDSPAYLFRSGSVQMISEDHSWPAEQARLGLITSEEARDHPYKHRLTRAVGVWEEVVDYTAAVALMDGDMVVLCSDGVESAGVEVDEVQRFLATDDLERALEEIIATCRDRGAPDNITVAVARVGEGSSAATETVRIGTIHELSQVQDPGAGTMLPEPELQL
jgi:protein phosphatase